MPNRVRRGIGTYKTPCVHHELRADSRQCFYKFRSNQSATQGNCSYCVIAVDVNLYSPVTAGLRFQSASLVKVAKRTESLNLLRFCYSCNIFQVQKRSKIDMMLRLRGTFSNRVPDLRMTCKVKYVNSAIRYAPQDTD